jgi:hypothetical protein
MGSALAGDNEGAQIGGCRADATAAMPIEARAAHIV